MIILSLWCVTCAIVRMILPSLSHLMYLCATVFAGMAFTSRQNDANIQTWGDLDHWLHYRFAKTTKKAPRREPGLQHHCSNTTGIPSVSKLLCWFTRDTWGPSAYNYGVSIRHVLHSTPLLCLGAWLWSSPSCLLSTWRYPQHQQCRLWLHLWGPDPKPGVQCTKHSCWWQSATMHLHWLLHPQ